VPEPVHRTAYVDALRADVVAAGPDPAASERREPLAVARKKALLRLLARLEAARLGWEVGELADMAVTFRVQNGLVGAGDVEAWLRREGLSDQQFRAFLEDACLVERLERLHTWDLAGDVAVQLAISAASRRG
jgi:hypothetical protein